jgi:hypothetical protein
MQEYRYIFYDAKWRIRLTRQPFPEHATASVETIYKRSISPGASQSLAQSPDLELLGVLETRAYFR